MIEAAVDRAMTQLRHLGSTIASGRCPHAAVRRGLGVTADPKELPDVALRLRSGPVGLPASGNDEDQPDRPADEGAKTAGLPPAVWDAVVGLVVLVEAPERAQHGTEDQPGGELRHGLEGAWKVLHGGTVGGTDCGRLWDSVGWGSPASGSLAPTSRGADQLKCRSQISGSRW